MDKIPYAEGWIDQESWIEGVVEGPQGVTGVPHMTIWMVDHPEIIVQVDLPDEKMPCPSMEHVYKQLLTSMSIVYDIHKLAYKRIYHLTQQYPNDQELGAAVRKIMI